jgi:hypothetical protein
MAKFGTTTKADGSNTSVASGILVEEMVTVASVQSIPSPMSMGEVAAIVEAEQVRAGQMDLIEMAKKAPTIATAPAYESKGVPSFGEKTVVSTLNKVEIIGEVCESCSA